jgi:hypothetical protein
MTWRRWDHRFQFVLPQLRAASNLGVELALQPVVDATVGIQLRRFLKISYGGFGTAS